MFHVNRIFQIRRSSDVHDIGHCTCLAVNNGSSECVIIFVNVISKSNFVVAFGKELSFSGTFCKITSKRFY